MEETTVTCAFCGGRGRDPFEILSKFSTCGVCTGTGLVTIVEPFVDCAFCHGSGVHPDRRMSCLGCKGKGRHTVPEPRTACPNCHGTGHERSKFDLDFACTVCDGAGRIAESHAQTLAEKAGHTATSST